MYNSYISKSCQISGDSQLRKFLDLGYLPPVNNYRLVLKKFTQEEIFFPTELFFSDKSKLVQLGCVVNKEILFPKSYPYTSSTTKILRENFSKLPKKLSKYLNLNKSDLVMDIGSNDGNLLSNFKNHCKVLGITPEDVGKIAIRKGIKTILKYFEKSTVDLILKRHQKAKVITATNVFAHIENPNEIVRQIKRCLTKDGIFVSESHYLIPLIQTLQYDTIYHEHLRYYSLTSLKYLLEKHGFRIFYSEKIPTHGGSIRVFASRSKNYKISSSVNAILKTEKKILTYPNLKLFEKNVHKNRIKLLKLIIDLKKKKKKIFGVGAPSRASTLINYVGIDENFVDCILEKKGSYKINKYMPGTNIPVYDEKILFKYDVDYLLLFSWHISKELISNLKKKGFKGKFIIPLPHPKII